MADDELYFVGAIVLATAMAPQGSAVLDGRRIGEDLGFKPEFPLAEAICAGRC